MPQVNEDANGAYVRHLTGNHSNNYARDNAAYGQARGNYAGLSNSCEPPRPARSLDADNYWEALAFGGRVRERREAVA
jgi:hypothetical protein